MSVCFALQPDRLGHGVYVALLDYGCILSSDLRLALAQTPNPAR